jgi:hypothetical protein
LARPRIHIEPGTRWDHLVYLEEAEAHPDGKRRVRCLCEACGNETTVRYDALQTHQYKSCGCQQKEASQLRFQKIFNNWDLPGGRYRKSNPEAWPQWLRDWLQEEQKKAETIWKNRGRHQNVSLTPEQARDIRLKAHLEQRTVARGCTAAEAEVAAQMLAELLQRMQTKITT